MAEGSYYRGTVASQSLFELVVELFILQMKYDIILHVIWIAGTRMIQQGTDDLSRCRGAGLATQGMAMRGEVPLSQGALERKVLLKPWIRSWVGEEGLVTLTPEGWFSDAHSRGSFYGRHPRLQRQRPWISYVMLFTSVPAVAIFCVPIDHGIFVEKAVVEGVCFSFYYEVRL
jgi:hypothetical protein